MQAQCNTDTYEPEGDAESGVCFRIITGPEMTEHCTKCSAVYITCECCKEDSPCFGKLGGAWLCADCILGVVKVKARMRIMELESERDALAAECARLREPKP